MIKFTTLLALACSATFVITWDMPHASMTARTWDGGGLTNNWSEAANWSGDAVPTSDDVVVFDGTSTKNATVDVSVSVPVFSINTGYTGTITIADGTIFTTFNNFGFNQSDGTLAAPNATINATMIIHNSGTFNGGIGNINVTNGISVLGGTYNAPSGTLSVNGGFEHRGGVFNHNNGTIRFGNGGLRFVDQDTFNNVTIDAPLNISSSSDFGSTGFNIIGTLRMVAGTVFNFGVTMNLTGDLVFAPGYTSNGPGDAFLRLAGTTPRTVTFPTGIQFFRLTLSSANTTVNFSGTNPITFQSLTIEQGRFDQGSTTLNVIQNFGQTGGTFNAGSAPLNQFGNNFTIDGGTFNGGSGDVTIGLNFSLSNGTFNAPSGSLFLNAGYNHSAGVFNANGGTVAFTRGGCNPFTFPNNETFNNLTINRECTLGLSQAKLIVLGTLTLTRGFLGGRAILEARGDVIVQPTWGQEFGLGPGDINFEFGGNSNQTYTNNGAANFVGEWSVNKPSGTVNLASDLDLRNGSTNAFRLTNGIITTGNFVVKIGIRNRIRTNGYVNGNLEQSYPFPGGPFLPIIFDVGTDNGYSPVEMTAQTVNVPSSIRVRAVQGTHPAISPAIALGRYWAITESGDITARLKFSYLDGDVNGNESNYKVDRITNGQVEILGPTVGSVNPATNTATTAELTDFGDFTMSTLALPLTISPTDVFADRLNPQDFSFAGGNPPFVYSLPVNNSGATINSVSGLYQAGPTSSVNDTVRVIDGDGNIAEATVRVVDPFVVSNTNEIGGGSLHRAITNANNTPGVQTISFNIAGTAPFTIATSTVSIPAIFDPVIIDATTQPGYSGTPLVEVKRAGSGNGLTIGRGPTTIRGLAISGFTNNINISDMLLGPCGGNIIEANLLGIGLTTPSSSQSSVGIKIRDCDGNFIGGPLPSQRNVISGNRTTGIDIFLGANANTIRGNFIGTAPDGISPMPNRANIRITTGDNTVGGTAPGEGNVIAFANDPTAERGTGVVILGGGTGNRVRGNSIFSNSGLGIELPDLTGPPPDGTFGVTPNDPCDTDGASNDLQNFPVLTAAVQSGGFLQVIGTLNSVPGQTFDIDLYASNAGDPSGNGEGQFFLGSGQVSTDASCNGSFSFSIPASVQNGQVISATATNANGSTSEFSAFILADVFDPLFIVANTNDSGPGSLRQAIVNANAAPGTQTIRFGIPGAAPHVISVTSQLPPITDPAVIDGSTQPGFAGVPVVQIRGSASQAVGLSLSAGNTTIKGLSITGFGAPIFPTGGISITSSNNVIRGNYIGISPAAASDRNVFGIVILNGSNNLIGGSGPADANVVSGNSGPGLLINGSDNTVEGNLIGTGPDGLSRQENGDGIDLRGTGNVVRSNIVSGNTRHGIISQGSDVVIESNRVGLNAALAPLGNGADGIKVSPGAAARNRISANRVFGNSALGIELGNFRTTGSNGPALPNDPQDPDAGSNNLQNFPVLTSATTSGSVTSITGTLNSTPSSTFTVEFFSNPSCDTSGNGEGETFLGSASVTTDVGGLVGFTKQVSQIPNGRLISATATSSNGSTSEFSPCQIVTPVNSISGRLTSNGQPLPFTTVSISGGVNTTILTDSNGNYTFRNLPSNLNYSIVPVSGNFSFTPANRTFNNLSTDIVNQDFAGSQTRFTVSGNISRSGDTGKGPLSGATVTLDGSTTRSVQTDINGNYRFAGVLGGGYTLTASKTGFFIAPGSVILNVNADQSVDFAAQSQLALPLTGRIYFTRQGDNLFAMNADGSGLVILIDPENVRSTISADGRKLAFQRNNLAIATAAEDGSSLTELTPGTEPAFSPDGTKIAFSKAVGTGRDLFTMNPDGTGLTRITFLNDQQRAVASFPNWSPDGGKIAFSVGGNICTINLTNGVVSTIAINGLLPDWSPDGTRIIFRRGNTLISMNANGSGQVLLVDNGTDQISKGVWAPDGSRILFSRQNRTSGRYEYVVADTNGANQIVILSDSQVNQISETPDWGIAPVNITPVGANVPVASGGVSITFPGITVPGETSIIPIPAASAGTAPGGFVLGTVAYEIATTATFTPPVTVCFNVPEAEAPTLAAFNALAILHSEGGVLVDRTVSRTFATRTICASVNSFSPFALGSQINASLPSINGLVIDSNGDPLVNVTVNLTGSEDRTAQTDSSGHFHFVNLTGGGNFNVQAKQLGYVFSEYSQDLIGITGENTVLFTGAAGSFEIRGKVTDGAGNGLPGIEVGLTSDGTIKTITDASGDYLFEGLPADGSYTVSPSGGGSSPGQIVIDPLLSDAAGVDFVQLAPSASGVPVSGRVTRPDGQGVGRVKLTIDDGNGFRLETITSPFGYFAFDDLEVGRTYILTASSKTYLFQDSTRVISLSDAVTDADFVTLSP